VRCLALTKKGTNNLLVNAVLTVDPQKVRESLCQDGNCGQAAKVAGAMTKSKAKWQQPDFGTRCHFQNIFTDFFLTMKKNAPEVTYFV